MAAIMIPAAVCAISYWLFRLQHFRAQLARRFALEVNGAFGATATRRYRASAIDGTQARCRYADASSMARRRCRDAGKSWRPHVIAAGNGIMTRHLSGFFLGDGLRYTARGCRSG